MKKTALVLVASTLAFGAYASSKTKISESLTLKPGQDVSISFPVGELELITTNGSQIELEISLKAKDEGWFSSNVDVDDVELQMESSDKLLKLDIDNEKLEQHWAVKIPQSANLDIQLGVGKVDIKDLTHSLNLDLGVGDVDVDLESENYREIELDAGVGDTKIRGLNGVSNERHMVSSQSDYQGKGEYAIDIKVGVGDIEVVR